MDKQTLFTVFIILIVLALAATPLTYYLRTRRNPVKPPPGASAKTFKEWKD